MGPAIWLARRGHIRLASTILKVARRASPKRQTKDAVSRFLKQGRTHAEPSFERPPQNAVCGQSARVQRRVATALLQAGFREAAVGLEIALFESAPDPVAHRRIVRYNHRSISELRDATRLLTAAIAEGHGAEVLERVIDAFAGHLVPGKLDERKSFPTEDPSDAVVDRQVEQLLEISSLAVDCRLGHRDLPTIPLLLVAQAFFQALRKSFPHLALRFGELLQSLECPPLTLRQLTDCRLRTGDLSGALTTMNGLKEPDGKLVAHTSALRDLGRRGFVDYPEEQPTQSPSADNRRVTYLLQNALPYFSGGYAARSHGLLGGIRAHGWDIEGLGRLGFPYDTPNGAATTAKSAIDGVQYRLLRGPAVDAFKTPMTTYLQAYGEALIQHLRPRPPSIVHAASFFMNGIAAVSAARALGCRTVYEIRGLKELTKGSLQPYWAGSEHYDVLVALETQAARDADAVFTLTHALKQEFVRRGVPAGKITVLPNGVHPERFVPRDRDLKLSETFGLKEDEVVIGYVGSFQRYEGLDLLMHAVARLRRTAERPFRVLMVGDGISFDSTVDLSHTLGLSDTVTFTGRIPHHLIEDIYSLIDICPLPRRGLPVCELVSPLKPFEAMAMSKAVVVSDVAALVEIVNDGVTGLVHRKDDVNDLADALARLVDDDELRSSLGNAARDWVAREHDWKVIASRVDEVYRALLAGTYGSDSRTEEAAQ